MSAPASFRSNVELLLSHEMIQKRVQELGQRITADYQGRTPHLIAILKGACIFLSDLVRHIPLPLSLDFIAVSSYGASTKSSGVVRITKDLDSSIEGRDVILIEDILDTGLTLSYLQEYLVNRNPASLKVCALLNKPSRRIKEVHADYIGFEIPDKFVVGYGLDVGQKYRNLPDICVVIDPGADIH
ncbi:MAG: hypoxanthine phosphoribosyltransferase [Terriglobia bacterium]